MTLDDLIAAYNNGYWSCYEEQHRAGIRAVVEALRDEFHKNYVNAWLGLTVDDIDADFNEILVAAGNEKAAGGPQDDGILIGNQNVEAIINDLHDEQKSKAAADPSPEVCEWSVSRDPDGEGHYETQCGNGWMKCVAEPPSRDGYNFCPSCGKPIVFKEATK